MRRIIFITIFLFFFLSFENLLSQDPPCLPPDPGDCPWVTTSYSRMINGCSYTFNVKYRKCNGILQYYYLGTQGPMQPCNNTDIRNVFNELDIQHYHINSFDDYMNFDFIEFHLASIDNQNPDLVPECPETIQLERYYQAKCGQYGKCTYSINPLPPDCDMGFEVPFDPNKTSLDVWGWKTCGVACCKRIFEICRTSATSVLIKSFQKLRISPCTNAPDGSDPKYATDCVDGC